MSNAVGPAPSTSRSTTVVTAVLVVLLAVTLWELWWQDATHLPARPTPVIALDEAWADLPVAEIHGTLTRDGDCLLVEGEVAFWQAETSWDADAGAVRYADADPVTVGGMVDGGGAHYDVTTDFSDLLGGPGRRVEACLEATGAPGAVFVYLVP